MSNQLDGIGRTVLITGAAGRIGTMLRPGLLGRGWKLRLLDEREIAAIRSDEIAIRGSVLDADLLAEVVAGVDAIVHLAGVPIECTFRDAIELNTTGMYEVLEAARHSGVRRVIYASSNHAVGFLSRNDSVDGTVALRPDSFYGLSKAFGECLARLYVDKYGLSVACLRIGSCRVAPENVRQLSTWLSDGDVVRLVDSVLCSPSLTFAVLYGISANARAWWNIEEGKQWGYEPSDNAELFADGLVAQFGELSEQDSDYLYVGGRFVD